MRTALGFVAGLLAAGFGGGQQVSAPAPVDPVVEAAQAWMPRALILHGLYGGAELAYDARGHVQGAPPMVDWTLAGMTIEKISRTDVGEMVLEGPRVAIRYNPDQKQFERHALKDERIRVRFPAADVEGVDRTMNAVFSVGIDPAVERAAPVYWRHFFFPVMEWTGEDKVGPVVLVTGVAAPLGLVMPVMRTKVEPEFTAEAQKDRVKGVVQVRMAVGLDGVPRQITIRQPLGYGLDAKTVAAVAKSRFTPGMQDGKPVVVEMIVNQAFDVAGK